MQLLRLLISFGILVFLSRLGDCLSSIVNEINTAWDKSPASASANEQWLEIKVFPPEDEDEEYMGTMLGKLPVSAGISTIEQQLLSRPRRVLHASSYPLTQTKLVVWSGEDETVHTVVDIDEVTDNNYYIIGNPRNKHELASHGIVLGWSSPRVQSASDGRTRGGFLATFWSHESAAALYRGPANIFAKLTTSLHCLDSDIAEMNNYILDIAFYSLHKLPNTKLDECFGKPYYEKSAPSEPRFARRDVTWCRCPPAVATNVPFQTGYWQNCLPTPLEANDCKTSLPLLQTINSAALLSATSPENIYDMHQTFELQPTRPICTVADKQRAMVDVQVHALREDGLRKGAGACPSKRQKVDLFDLRFRQEEKPGIQPARVTSDKCLASEGQYSIYSTTSAMKPYSLEWKQFFSKENTDFKSDIFTQNDVSHKNVKRWFWLEGLISNGFTMRCHVCHTYWDAYKAATKASMQKRSEITMLNGKNYGSYKENERRARQHALNPDHLEIISWRGRVWNKNVINNVQETENKIYNEERASTNELDRLFRTIYFGAKKNIAYTTIDEMVQLQIVNSASFGDWRHSRRTVDRISKYIAIDLDAAMRKFILEKRPLCAVTIDGWRNVFGTEHLLVSMKFMHQGLLQTWFLRSVPLDNEDAEATYDALYKAVTTALAEPDTVNEDMMLWFQESVVGFASDGAGVMIGTNKGVAARLQKFVGERKVFRVHCMAHRVELAMSDALGADDCAVDKLEASMREIHRLHVKGGGTFAKYKRLGAMYVPAVEVRRMRSLDGIRWRAIVGDAMETVVQDYRILKMWFEQNKFTKLAFLFSPEGVYWLHASNELFKVVGLFSKCLQNREGQIFTVGERLEDLLLSLAALELDDFMPISLAVTDDNTLQIQSEDGVDDIFLSLEGDKMAAFLKAKMDFKTYVAEVRKGFDSRFPPEQRDLLQSLGALNFKTWPTDTEELDHFGDEGIRALAKFVQTPLRYDSTFINGAVSEWHTFKHKFNELVTRDYVNEVDSLYLWQLFLSGASTNPNIPVCPILGTMLSKVVECALLLPVSSAENERLAHALSLIDSGATRKTANTASSRLFLQQNGPTWQNFDARTYALSWARRHKHLIPIVISDMVEDVSVRETYTSDFATMLSQAYFS